MHAIDYDEVHDEIVVSQQFGQAILTFRGGAHGEEAPIRVIQGPRTQLHNLSRLTVDPVNNEIFVPDRNQVLVFPREGQGDVAPIRILSGPDTQLGSGAVAVDPVHDLLIVAGSTGSGENRKVHLLIFNRTDQGNAKPRAVISGPRTGLTDPKNIRVYPPRGWILVAQDGLQSAPGEEEASGESFVGVWSINDNGNVPPRWTIGGPNGSLKKPRGVALDPENKTVIVSDKYLNAALTYSLPELF